MKRRELLATGAGVAAAGAALWPLAAGIATPLEEPAAPREAPWVDVAGEKELQAAPLRAVVRVPVRDGYFTILEESGAVWLRRGPDGGIAALSATCPHLGCGISQDNRGGYVCPCHASRFAADGALVRGPSPRGMDPLPVRLADGRILVQALRFASGGKTRRAL